MIRNQLIKTKANNNLHIINSSEYMPYMPIVYYINLKYM